MPDWLMQSVGYVGALAVGYAAIRADLARLHIKADQAAKTDDRAHERIDCIMERSHG